MAWQARRGIDVLRAGTHGGADFGRGPGSGEGCCDRAGRADAGQLVKRANPRKIQAKKGLAAVDLNPKPAMMTRRIIPTSVNKGREQP
jgi:hypothetical protein